MCTAYQATQVRLHSGVSHFRTSLLLSWQAAKRGHGSCIPPRACSGSP
jgi:hypothetical protein